jgi:phosphoglycolate phosphatase
VRESDFLRVVLPVYDTYYEQRCGTRSHLYPKVRETLVSLREQGVKLAVVTNKEGRYTQVVLNVHQLTPMFDAVISGDTLPVKKPNPAGVVHCLSLFGVSSDRALFVGDSSIDAATARNAGLPVWLLPYGYNMGQPIEACAPDRVIQDFSSLLNQ